MDPLDTFIEALSLLPGVAHLRQQAMRTWGVNMPLQLDFALAGAQIAQHLPGYGHDEQTYLRGMLSHGLCHESGSLRSLVRCSLIAAMLANSRRIGEASEQAVLAQLAQVAEWRNVSAQPTDAGGENATAFRSPDRSMDRPYATLVPDHARADRHAHAVHDDPRETKRSRRRK